jgi:hypothetical protein
MKKAILSLLLLIAIASLSFAATVFFIDYDKTYKHLLETVGIKNDSAGAFRYEIVKFPSPHLLIEKVTIDDKLDVKDIEIHFSILSLLRLDPKVVDLKAKEVILYLENDDVNFIRHDEFISELIQKEYLTAKINIGKLTFVESDKDIALEITNFVFNGKKDSEQFSGDVDAIGKISGVFKKSDKDQNITLLNLDIQGNGFKALLNENYESGVFKSGLAELYTSNVPNKIGKLFPDISALAKNLNSDEEVKITFEIDLIDEGLFFKNILINSLSLQGAGEVYLGKDQNSEHSVKFNFSKIDLNSWKKSESSVYNQVQIDYGNKTKLNLNNNLKADVTITRMQLDDTNYLADVDFSCYTEDGRLRVKNFAGKLNQNGSFKINGQVSQNSFRSLFEGEVSLIQEDLNDLAELIGGKETRTENKIPYTLTSDIKISSVDLSMQNTLLKTPSTEIQGNFSTKLIGNSPRTNANLRFSNANVTDKSFPGLFQIYDYITSLTDNMKDTNYFNKFITLRKIKSLSNYSITFDKMTVGNQTYEHVYFNLGLSPGRVRIDNLYLSNGKDFVDADIDLIASGVKPVILLKIKDGAFGVGFLNIESMLKMKDNILANYAPDKISLNLDASLSKIYQDDLELTNVTFLGSNNNTLLEIKKFETNLLKGRFISAGSILFDPFTVNLVYALNSASVESITNLFPEGLIKSGGFTSASGMISTSGNNINELLYNLYTKSSVITKDITIDNFSIDELIEKLTAKDYVMENFKDDVKTALLTGKTLITDLKLSDVELFKGLIKIPSIIFKTKYTAASAKAELNIYDFGLNLNSVFSFFMTKSTKSQNVGTAPVKIEINATSSVFSPKKEAITKDLEDFINSERKLMKSLEYRKNLEKSLNIQKNR